MPGFIDYLEAFVMSLQTATLRPQRAEGAKPSTVAEDEFLIGTSMPFGTLAPAPGTEVSVPFMFLEKHVCLTGPSGSGKTLAIRRYQRTAIAAMRSIFAIDYRGDSVEPDVEQLVADEVDPERVTLYDFRDTASTIPFNLLGFGPGDPFARSESAYRCLEAESGGLGVQNGPDLRLALFVLASLQSSLLEVDSFLAPEGSAFRRYAIEHLQDDYFRDQVIRYDALPPDVQRQRFAAVSNKLVPLLHHVHLRRSLGISGAPDFGRLLDTPGHVTMVSLGVDRNPQAKLLGRLLVGAAQRHVLGRVDLKEADRNPVTLIVDEFSNLADDSFCQLLAEAMRFRCALLCAFQHASQVSTVLHHALKTNCSSQLQFQCSAEESGRLASEVVSSLPSSEVKQLLQLLPVGCALLQRKGEPAALVRTPEAPRPKVTADAVRAFKEQIHCSAIPVADADRELQRRRVDLAALVGSQPKAKRTGRKFLGGDHA